MIIKRFAQSADARLNRDPLGTDGKWPMDLSAEKNAGMAIIGPTTGFKGRDVMVYDSKPTDRGELNEFDRKLIKEHVRIRIPLYNKPLLREVADLLRGMATELDFTSRRLDLPLKDALLIAQNSVQTFNCQVKLACSRHEIKLRDGRPTDVERGLSKAPDDTVRPFIVRGSKTS